MPLFLSNSENCHLSLLSLAIKRKIYKIGEDFGIIQLNLDLILYLCALIEVSKKDRRKIIYVTRHYRTERRSEGE